MPEAKKSVQDYQDEIPAEVAESSGGIPYEWEAAVGAVLREVRESRGWSQAFAVDRLRDEWGMDMHQTTLAKLEAGKRPIRLAELYALSLLYGQSVLMVLMQEAVRVHMLESADHVDSFYYQEQAEIEKMTDDAVGFLRNRIEALAHRKAMQFFAHGYLSERPAKADEESGGETVRADGQAADATE